MKECTACNKLKTIEEFGKDTNQPDGLRYQCKTCHATLVIARQRKMYEVIREAKNKPCMDCGINYPSYVMDFDHRPGEIKIKNLSRMNGYGLDKIKEEIEKCDLVCANCHRERTFSRIGLSALEELNVFIS